MKTHYCIPVIILLLYAGRLTGQSNTQENPPLPANIILGSAGPYIIASVYDEDYLPFTLPAGPATLATSQPANGIKEDVPLNIQGILTIIGVTIKIPYTVAGGPVTLPAYSQSVTIPAAYTEDGVPRQIRFYYPAATLREGRGYINAVLKSAGGRLNVKKLDLQSGIGSDGLGVLLAQFSYATDSKGHTARFEVRAIAGIPDRNINDNTHQMLYLPVVSSTGRTWLNNNLGADYCNSAKAVFNPMQQATGPDDHNAYGSLFQWGRSADGHEIINWAGSEAGTPVNGTTAIQADIPGNSLFIIPHNSGWWQAAPNSNPWNGEAAINNPCPVGFRIPTQAELEEEKAFYGITNLSSAYNSVHKFTAAGFRGARINNAATVGNYYTSSVRDGDAVYSYLLFFNASRAATTFLTQSGKGRSVRCIKD